MISRTLRLAAYGVLLSTTALAQQGPIHQPMPTAAQPGDAPPGGIIEPHTIVVDPSAGDVSLKYQVDATIKTRETGRARTPEIINPAPETVDAAPVPEVAAIEQTPQADQQPEEDINEPAIHESNGIRYVSGGIGEHDMKHIKSLQKDFKLKLEFSASSGNFLSDVTVTFLDKGGKDVLTLTTEGPILLVDLPAGTYEAKATYDNAEQSKKVTVSEKGLKGYTVVFTQPVT